MVEIIFSVVVVSLLITYFLTPYSNKLVRVSLLSSTFIIQGADLWMTLLNWDSSFSSQMELMIEVAFIAVVTRYFWDEYSRIQA